MIICEKSTAVVILSYNSVNWHKLFLPKIVEQSTSGYEVIVVDHASPDDTAEYISANYPSVKLICLEKNLGFAGGYAAALEQIKADYYVLLSADFEVTDNWFPPLLNAFNSNPQLAACQPKVRYYKDRPYFEYAGAAGGFMDKWGYMFCRGRIFDTLEVDENQYQTSIEVFWASGGCLMVRADLYHKVGGLDADLQSHMEEIDLCWRLQNEGYKIGVIPSSTVFHVGGSVISYGSPQKTYLNFRNNLAIIVKNDTEARVKWLIPLRLILDGVACLPFLKKGQFNNIWAVVKAHNHFFRSYKLWKNKRKKTVSSNIPTIFNQSIVWQYFAKNKRKFSDLNIKTHTLN